ncbi:MAG TPA: type II secretion system protein [Labilithrix sp.]
MTLIEVLIVLAIVAIVMGAVVIGSGRTASAQQRHTATMITGAVRVGFARSSATSKSVRLVMDFDNSQIWLEEGDQPMLVQTKDVTATGGASPATVAEKQALEESGRILKGPTPPKPSFNEIDPMGMVSSDPGKTRKSLPAGIKFREVQTSHDAAPITKGRAYLYFWPGGQTERASIQLEIAKKDESGNPEHDPKFAVTMLVAPLTGKVTIKDGAVAIATPQDDKEASEREDPGAF